MLVNVVIEWRVFLFKLLGNFGGNNTLLLLKSMLQNGESSCYSSCYCSCYSFYRCLKSDTVIVAPIVMAAAPIMVAIAAVLVANVTATWAI